MKCFLNLFWLNLSSTDISFSVHSEKSQNKLFFLSNTSFCAGRSSTGAALAVIVLKLIPAAKMSNFIAT